MLMRDEPVIGQNCMRSRGFCFFCPQKKKESKCSLIVVYWVELSQIMLIRFEYYGVSPATLDLSFVYGRSAEPGRIAAYHGSCTFAGSTPEGIPLGKVPKGFGCEDHFEAINGLVAVFSEIRQLLEKHGRSRRRMADEMVFEAVVLGNWTREYV
jgi:hypothetical protein